MQIRLLLALIESPGYMNSMSEFKSGASSLLTVPAASRPFSMILLPMLEMFSNVEHRVAFESRPSIFVPAAGAREAIWVLPRQCLWEAPPDMKTKYPLKSLYEGYFSQGNGGHAYITHFFKRTLSISDVVAENFLEELKALKSTRCMDFDRINGLYESINSMRPEIAIIVESFK
jgi:hypothetical protein